MSSRVLYMFHDGMEDIEAVAPLDLLRRAECEVLTVSVSTQRQVITKCDVPMMADECLRHPINSDDYDAIVIPGGPGIHPLRTHGYLSNLIDVMYQEHKWIAAICAAPLLLKDQGLLDGRDYTSHPTTAEELPDRIENQAVVVDGCVITSQGAGTAVEFGLKLVEIFVSREKAAELATAICMHT
jgi:4-methyl-5(b-hydroxyethyl)-thiazole monophosphate biosynthesis